MVTDRAYLSQCSAHRRKYLVSNSQRIEISKHSLSAEVTSDVSLYSDDVSNERRRGWNIIFGLKEPGILGPTMAANSSL